MWAESVQDVRCEYHKRDSKKEAGGHSRTTGRWSRVSLRTSLLRESGMEIEGLRGKSEPFRELEDRRHSGSGGVGDGVRAWSGAVMEGAD